MSLNDDAISDLHEEADYITQPEATAVKAAVDIVVIPELPLTEEEKEAAASAVGVLEAQSATIQTNVDEVKKLHDLNEVSSLVLAQESINKSDAVLIENVCGSDYVEKFSVEEYSETPSRTNLIETKRFLERYRETKSKKLIDDFLVYSSEVITQGTALLSLIEKAAEPTMSNLDDVRETALAALKLSYDNGAYLVYVKDGAHKKLRDLRKTHLYLFSTEDLSDVKEDFPVKADSLRRLREFIAGNEFGNLYVDATVNGQCKYWRIRQSSSVDTAALSRLDYLSLLSLFTENRISNFLQVAVAEAVASLEIATKLSKSIEQGHSDSPDADACKKIGEAIPALEDTASLLVAVHRAFRLARTLSYLAKPVIEQFIELGSMQAKE